ncbi:hypothetical protein [Limnochorda pilosa]|uniref:Uncharacterized protein n=1 Tax=Limnochorda pilosa TaxID=1555112 RepID=A0A0K2SMM6_LIMPI|nr:hypothetical protein [Limnochorda pilosa]BAS28360.1 hypothetical protein LIP_2530 [Limnochorda pilosa]
MPERLIIPSPEPLPLPADPILLQGLLLLTFVLHILFMSQVLGGSLLYLGATVAGGRKSGHPLQRLAHTLAGLFPWTVAFTITTGVAPLLFVQLLYGSFFYSSSVLMAWPWFAVVPMLIVGYYALYWVSLKGKDRPAWARLTVGGLAAVVFLAIGFLYSTNLSLMQRPEVWAGVYAANPYGTSLVTEAALAPRFLHAVLGAVALASVLVLVHGAASAGSDAAYGRAVTRFGLASFVPAALLQAVVAPWYASHLVPAVRDHLFDLGSLLGQLTVAALVVSALAFVLLVAARGRLRYTGAGAALVVAGQALLLIVRHMARNQALAGYMPEGLWRVVPQTALVVLFLALLVVGLATVGYMALRVRRDRVALAEVAAERRVAG